MCLPLFLAPSSEIAYPLLKKKEDAFAKRGQLCRRAEWTVEVENLDLTRTSAASVLEAQRERSAKIKLKIKKTDFEN